MCSFIFTNKPLQGDRLNFLSARRGPDHTEITNISGFNMIHNLLDISKRKIIQPVSDGNITLLFNGEIYEPQCKDGDTLSIIPLYKEYGKTFVEQINGEYSIVILDKSKNIVLLYSDIFGTKPLFYAIEGTDIGVASYASELKILGFKDIKRVMHSSFLEIELNGLDITEYKHGTFNLEEYKTSYQDCIEALEHSFRLRCNDKVAVGLSSGHDSGSMLLWSILNNKQDNHFYYITNGRESPEIMQSRKNLCKKHNLPFAEIDYYKSIMLNDELELKTLPTNMEEWSSYWGANSICLKSRLLKVIKKDGINIFLTGQGGDEILSNYRKYTNFFKDFNLKEQFPWPNFYEGKNREFIDEFEYVGGAHGMEVRYPFLDKKFVQEFLNLTNDLKKAKFKSVLAEYLASNNFPTNNFKVGMGPRLPRYCNNYGTMGKSLSKPNFPYWTE